MKFEIAFEVNGVCRCEYFFGKDWQEAFAKLNKKYCGERNTVIVFGKVIFAEGI